MRRESRPPRFSHTRPPSPTSFYHLHSSVLHHATHKSLNAVYSFYNVATSMTLKVRRKKKGWGTKLYAP